MGLNHVLVKLSAFMLGASTAGIAGVFFASYQGFVNPTSFTFFESALILAIGCSGEWAPPWEWCWRRLS